MALLRVHPFALETSKADANRLLTKISSVFNRYFIDPTSKQLKKPGPAKTVSMRMS